MEYCQEDRHQFFCTVFGKEHRGRDWIDHVRRTPAPEDTTGRNDGTPRALSLTLIFCKPQPALKPQGEGLGRTAFAER